MIEIGSEYGSELNDVFNLLAATAPWCLRLSRWLPLTTPMVLEVWSTVYGLGLCMSVSSRGRGSRS
jgi:hypothetical protein